MGAERLVQQLEDPEALDGQGGFWPGIEKREEMCIRDSPCGKGGPVPQ